MKMPDLKDSLAKLKAKRKPAGDGNSLKAPKFATDLYADLRDRRLLPLAALLVVAIAAVPFLLGGGDEEEEMPPPAPPAVVAESAQAGFSVVPAREGLRDYRKRLGYREARNPFEVPPRKQAGGEAGGSGSKSSEAAESGEGSSGGEGATGGESAGGETTTETTTDVVVERELKSWTVNLQVGFVRPDGPDLHAEKGVEPMTELPNKKNPAIVFVGLTEDRDAAVFLMTDEVTAYYGKGRCSVNQQSCQLLELPPGKSATFAIGFGETRYKVHLDAIVPVYKTRTGAATVTERSEDK
jgi:hypothetical protein